MVEVTYKNQTILIENAIGFNHDPYHQMFIVETTSGNKVHIPDHSVLAIGFVVDTGSRYVYE